MAKPVFELSVMWDGEHLIANRRCGDGWRDLTGKVPVHEANASTPCTELEDLTPFELGLFLAVACRPFTDGWWEGQPQLVALVDERETRAAG